MPAAPLEFMFAIPLLSFDEGLCKLIYLRCPSWFPVDPVVRQNSSRPVILAAVTSLRRRFWRGAGPPSYERNRSSRSKGIGSSRPTGRILHDRLEYGRGINRSRGWTDRRKHLPSRFRNRHFHRSDIGIGFAVADVGFCPWSGLRTERQTGAQGICEPS